MLVHILPGQSVRDARIAHGLDQPIEKRVRVTTPDGSADAIPGHGCAQCRNIIRSDRHRADVADKIYCLVEDNSLYSSVCNLI